MDLLLRYFVPADLLQDVPTELSWHIPAWAYRPSQWTFAFLRGLRKLGLISERSWEIGVGTGLNMLFMSRWFPSTAAMYFSDLNPECIELATLNLHQARLTNTALFKPLWGVWDLTKRVDERCSLPPLVDLILACIPQVPLPPTLKLRQGDNMAHYYDTARYGDGKNLGLGLNQAQLSEARRILPAQGRVVLNLGGRPGKDRLLAMFSGAGFRPELLHHEIILQERETSLSSLAEIEQSTGLEFEFFGDALGREQINAREAERRRLAGVNVYHYIYVIAGHGM